jgi:hypothetical protein
MGNVGQHYYAWRYNTAIPAEPAAPDAGSDDMGPAPLVNWPVDHDGQSLVEISNQSPYPLTITFEGPVTQTLTIDACPDCVEYTSSAAFTNCRNDIPYQDVTLPPGNYKVSTEHGASNVTRGSGPWTIVPNGEYGECIYVVRQRAPASVGPTHAATAHAAADMPR